MESSVQAWLNVARGLVCTLAALSLPLASFMIWRLFDRESSVPFYFIWAGLALHAFGQAMCLTMAAALHRGSLLGASLGLTIIGLLIVPGNFLRLVAIPDGTLEMEEFSQTIQIRVSVFAALTCHMVAWVAYLFFLRALARHLKKPDLTRSISVSLWICSVWFACAILLLAAMASSGGPGLLGLFGAALAMFLAAIMTVHAVYRVREAVMQRIRESVVPTQLSEPM